MSIETLEQQLMTALLSGDDPVLEVLRTQYSGTKVKSRKVSERGFTTWFDVPREAPLADRGLLHLDDLQLELAGVASPVEAVVTVEKGRLRSLECSVYSGSWPEDPQLSAAWYYGTDRYPGITPELLAARDLEALLDDDE